MDGSVNLRWSSGYVGSRLRGNDEDGGAGMTDWGERYGGLAYGMDGSVDLRWSPGYVGSRPRLHGGRLCAGTTRMGARE